MELLETLRKIGQDPHCRLAESRGIPELPEGAKLPADLAVFYKLTGGVLFYEKSEYPLVVVGPEDFIVANRILVPDLSDLDDPSENWFILARNDELGQFVTIDLSPGPRNGYCYDSFHESHGVADSMPIIARSFSEFLDQIHRNRGAHWYWLQDSFEDIGDAYE